MNQVFKKEKKKQPPSGQHSLFAEIVFSLVTKVLFGLIIFPWIYLKLAIKSGNLLVAFGLMLHERKEFKVTNDRYSHIPKNRSWTNPEFFTEAELSKTDKKRFFFPEG